MPDGRPVWWRLPASHGLRSRPRINLRQVCAVAWEEPGMSRISTADGRAYLCPGTPGQVQASMDWTWDHPLDQIDPPSVGAGGGAPGAPVEDAMRVYPDNIAELGHGARLEQRGGDVFLVRVDGTEAQIEGGTGQSIEDMEAKLKDLGLYGGMPEAAKGWLLNSAGQPSVGMVGGSTMTQPFGAAAVGPFAPDLKQAPALEGRAGVGDQTMAGNTLTPPEDGDKAQPKSPAEEPQVNQPAASASVAGATRTDPATQATRGNTAQPSRRKT